MEEGGDQLERHRPRPVDIDESRGLVRRGDLVGRDAPGVAARRTETLGLDETRFAPSQCCVCLRAVNALSHESPVPWPRRARVVLGAVDEIAALIRCVVAISR
jgi:hypothetical protein